MEFDQFALVERILKDVNNVFRKETNLQSFEIVPVHSNNHNKSPVLHQGNFLGLEAWCVKHVYMTCYSELMDTVSRSRKKNKSSSIDNDKLMRLLNVTLLINPDLSTLWNRRRQMAAQGLLDMFVELRFVGVVLSRKPKCNEAFTYRRWILERLLRDATFVQSTNFEQTISDELRLCSSTAEQIPSNYHSWTHRVWLVQQLASSKNIPENYLYKIYCTEYALSDQWAVTHISDHSCYWYRQFCIQNAFKLPNSYWNEFDKHTSANLRRNFVKIIAENMPVDATKVSETELSNCNDERLIQLLLGKTFTTCECETQYSTICHQMELLFYELTLNDDLIRFYKNHETLWYHRRFIVHHILAIIHKYHGVSRTNVKVVKSSCSICRTDIVENKAKMVRYDAECVYSSLLYLIVISCDKKTTTKQRSEGDNYADRHEKYLKFIEGVGT